jgi:hypothetical protein
VRIVVVLLVAAIGIGAFYAGRASKTNTGGSFAAGRESAFDGFDGGWTYGQPYVITLKRGGPGVTYAIATRRPLHVH